MRVSASDRSTDGHGAASHDVAVMTFACDHPQRPIGANMTRLDAPRININAAAAAAKRMPLPHIVVYTRGDRRSSRLVNTLQAIGWRSYANEHQSDRWEP